MKKNVTTAAVKEPVKLRKKPLKNGGYSLYLDTWQDGKRTYDYLKMYLIPDTSTEARAQNKNTMAAAMAIKAAKVKAIYCNKAGVSTAQSLGGKVLLYKWVEACSKRKNVGKKRAYTIKNVAGKLKQFQENAKLKDVDVKFCCKFIDWLQNEYSTPKRKTVKKITVSSLHHYAEVLNMALSAAVRAELIPNNPYKKLETWEKPHGEESKREFLTVEEVKTLRHTFCKNAYVKRAFLFSCYCGLRYGDIQRLTWGDIKEDGENKRIEIKQHKTQRSIFLPLSQQAVRCLPPRNEAKGSDNIFNLLLSPTHVGRYIKAWVKAAGIDKYITFHCARHTFATMMLTLGADLYTTSKLLGHTQITTTQIYAKIVDSKKEEAVNLVDKLEW